MRLSELFYPKPVAVPDGPVVETCPYGFFRIVIGKEKYLAYSHPVFGLTVGVRNSFRLGGQSFSRDLRVAMPVWIKPNYVESGTVVRGDQQFRETASLETFDGNYSYSGAPNSDGVVWR